MSAPQTTIYRAVLRMLRAANGGWVTHRYLTTAVRGLGGGPTALTDSISRARRRLEPGEALENMHGHGYRIRRVAP